MTGCGIEEGRLEVDMSISRLFTYASYADKYGGAIQETAFSGVTSSINEPVGVVGVVCSNDRPLLQFVSAVAPAVVRGNSVVVCPSEVRKRKTGGWLKKNPLVNDQSSNQQQTDTLPPCALLLLRNTPLRPLTSTRCLTPPTCPVA